MYSNNFVSRSQLYNNLLCLLVMSSPCIYDQAVLFLDFGGILFTGFVLLTLYYLTNDSGYSNFYAIFFFNCAIFSSLTNSIYLQPLILYFVYFRSYYKKGLSANYIIVFIHISLVIAFSVGIIFFITQFNIDDLADQYSWSYNKTKVDE